VPFLRVLRDRRGYETTYLMHWFREGTRQRSKVLYVFRTPGGVRVGRSPLDGEALREIEARYPEIAFDWDSVRENQHVIEPAPPMRRRRPKRDESETGALPAVDAAASEPRAPQPSPSPIPAALEGATPDEQIAFLMRWYPIVRDRIAMRIADPERRTVLTTLAERLNPAAWTDADQIASGLQQAGEALERLSRVLVRRRRRSKKRPGGSAPAAPSATPGESIPDSIPSES
jgi:hypothetical protein